MNKLFSSLLIAVITNTWVSIAVADDWSKDELIGTWVSEEHGVNAMSILGKSHAIYVMVNENRKPFANDPPTETEMAEAYKAISAASLKFDVTEPGRWIMEFINAQDPTLTGVRVTYEYEWLDEEKTKIRYWVLDEKGSRTEETGVSRRLQ